MNIQPTEPSPKPGPPPAPFSPQKGKEEGFIEKCLSSILSFQASEHPEILTQKLSASQTKAFLLPNQIEGMLAIIREPARYAPTPVSGPKEQEASPFLFENRDELLQMLYEDVAREFLQQNPILDPAIHEIQDEKLKVRILQLYIEKEEDPDFPFIALQVSQFSRENKLAVALHCAKNNALRLAFILDIFQITFEEDRMRLVQEMIKGEAVSFVLNIIARFDLSEQNRVAIAYECLKYEKAVMHLPRCMSQFHIQDAKLRAELALLCAQKQKGAASVAHYISEFALPEKELEEIARICMKKHKGLEALVANIKQFHLSEEMRFLIGLKCCLHDVFFYPSQLDLPEEQKISLLVLRSGVSLLRNQENLPPLFQMLEMPEDMPLKQLFEKAKKNPKLRSYLILIHIALRLQPQLQTNPEWQKTVCEIIANRNIPLVLSLLEFFCLDVAPNHFETFSKLTSGLTYMQLPALQVAKWLSKDPSLQVDADRIVSFIKKQKLAFKDGRTGLEYAWLLTMQALEESSLSPASKMRLVASACKTSSWEELKKRFTIIRALCSHNRVDLLDRPFSDKMTEELSSLLFAEIQKDDFVPLAGVDHFLEKYMETWGETRIPQAWLIYETQLRKEGDPKLQEEFSRMILSVLNGTHLQERYRTDINPHLAKMQEKCPDVFAAWQGPPTKRSISPGKELVDTDDWQDLFLCGTEVGSCQSLDWDPHYSRCLLAYVMDGKNRILCIKDSMTGTIVARCMVRLLWDETHNQPVLLQEPFYPKPAPSQEFQDALHALAREKAAALGCPLLATDITLTTDPYPGKVVSLGSATPYEYVDGMGRGASAIVEYGHFRLPEPRQV